MKNAFIGCLASLFALNAVAGDAPQTYKHAVKPSSGGWAWHLYAESVSLDSEQAASQRIKDSAVAIGAGAEYYIADTTQAVRFGFAFMQYSDLGEFSVLTEQQGGFNDGEIDNKSSDANGMQLYVDYGIQNRFGANNGGFYTVRGGYALMFGSERAIASCTNCPSQDIDIESGLYGLVGVGFNATPAFSLGLNYKQYFSGDVENALQLELRWAY